MGTGGEGRDGLGFYQTGCTHVRFCTHDTRAGQTSFPTRCDAIYGLCMTYAGFGQADSPGRVSDVTALHGETQITYHKGSLPRRALCCARRYKAVIFPKPFATHTCHKTIDNELHLRSRMTSNINGRKRDKGSMILSRAFRRLV